MADVEVTGKDATLRQGLQVPPGSYNDDEDLIDYDSDDAFAQNLKSYAITSHSDLLAHDLNDAIVHSEPKDAAKADSAVTANEGKCASKGQKHQIDGKFTHGGSETTAPSATTESFDHSGRCHEIDYDAHDFTREESSSEKSNRSLAAVADKPQSPAAAQSEASSNTSPQKPVERYEIDWEDDEVQETTDQDVSKTETCASNAHVLELSEQVPERNNEHLDFEDEDTQPDFGDSAPEQLEGLPTITVQYRGEEYPFLSPTSDGFFTDVSILDRTMEDVLAGFRAELSDEIGPQDDLVLQVDRLGLEFSESSPGDTLQSLSMRQILELLEILVKNQDCENDRLLPTYLFTRPNTMKRYEFLIERATRDAGLAEVIHLFPPPRESHSQESNNISDDNEDGPERDWNASHDSATHVSHDTSDIYDGNTAYDHGLDVRSMSSSHGVHKAGVDENPTVSSNVDGIHSDSDQEPEHERRITGIEAVTDEANDEAGLDDGIDVENEAHDAMTLSAERTVMNMEDEAMDGIAVDHEEDQSEHDDTPNITTTGTGHASTEVNDADLIHYPSTHEKSEVDGDWLATEFQTSNDEDTGQQVEDLFDLESSGDRMPKTHDEDLIDYERGGEAAEDGRPENGAFEASDYYANDGQNQLGDALDTKYDANLIDYSTDGKPFNIVDSIGLGKEKDFNDEMPTTQHEDSHDITEEIEHGLERPGSVQDAQATRDNYVAVEIHDTSTTTSSSRVHQDTTLEQELDVLDENEEATCNKLDDATTSVARQPPKDASETRTAAVSSTTTVRVDEEAIGASTISLQSARHVSPAVEIDWDGSESASSVDGAGSTAEAKSTTMMKRAYSAEMDENDGNELKRRRS